MKIDVPHEAPGQRVKLPEACPNCGLSWLGITTGPKGPHFNGVRCDACGSFLGWAKRPKGATGERDDEFLVGPDES